MPRNHSSSPNWESPSGRMNLSPLDAALTRWTFRFVLLRSAHSREALAGMAADSRFGGCQIEESGIELELRLAKPA